MSLLKETSRPPGHVNSSSQPGPAIVRPSLLLTYFTIRVLYFVLSRIALSYPISNPALTLDGSHSYRLFVVAKKLNSFAIKQIHTLYTKHPGWVCPCAVNSWSPVRRSSSLSQRWLSAQPLFTEMHRGNAIPGYRFSSPLFSDYYKSLFPQRLSFHI